MTGPQLAMLGTLGWVVLVVILLVAFGTSGFGWTILPGLVRGVRDWAAEQAGASGGAGEPGNAREAARPSPHLVAPATGHDHEGEPGLAPLVEIEELGCEEAVAATVRVR
jgi:hypothetical protein